MEEPVPVAPSSAVYKMCFSVTPGPSESEAKEMGS